MNKRTQEKYNIYDVVLIYMDNHVEEWQNLPYICDDVAMLRANRDLILKNGGEQNADRSGTTLDKKDKRDNLVNVMVLVNNLVYGYASVVKNTELQNQMRFKKSFLKRSRDKVLVFDAGLLMDIVLEHETALANYGVGTALIDELRLNTTAFNAVINSPAEQRRLRKEASNAVRDLTKETDYLMAHIFDMHMQSYMYSRPTFYSGYKQNRKGRAYPTIQLDMRIFVTDAATQEALPKALVQIKDHQIKRKTSPKGQIVVRNLAVGSHKITVSLKGYKTTVITAEHVKGETNVASVQLERE